MCDVPWIICGLNKSTNKLSTHWKSRASIRVNLIASPTLLSIELLVIITLCSDWSGQHEEKRLSCWPTRLQWIYLFLFHNEFAFLHDSRCSSRRRTKAQLEMKIRLSAAAHHQLLKFLVYPLVCGFTMTNGVFRMNLTNFCTWTETLTKTRLRSTNTRCDVLERRSKTTNTIDQSPTRSLSLAASNDRSSSLCFSHKTNHEEII